MTRQSKWTAEKVEELKARYPAEGPAICGDLGLSRRMVIVKAHELRIAFVGSRGGGKRKSRQQHRWTDEMLALLTERYAEDGDRGLAERLGTTAGAVRAKASILGLNRKPSVNEDYFETWTPNMAYALGYIWADGSINRGLDQLFLNCVTEDEAILLAIRADMGSTHKVRTTAADSRHGRNSRGQTGCAICSGKLIASLHDQHGLRPNKSRLDLPFPAVPDEYMPHFVRGYFDGDGCVNYASNGERTLTIWLCGTRSFLAGMQEAICRLTNVRKNKLSCQHGLYSTQWSSRQDVFALAGWLYPAGDYIFLPRKRDKVALIYTLPICTYRRKQGAIYQ